MRNWQGSSGAVMTAPADRIIEGGAPGPCILLRRDMDTVGVAENATTPHALAALPDQRAGRDAFCRVSIVHAWLNSDTDASRGKGKIS